ncbi:bifunctional diaminohydroxyphosphoribosylaminopyrimidine deaminase/5-amino-6-(5-phosphoribosylamino)uracil reductase RibD [Pseudogemmobacter faecipullorum]|uniref:Bifunctional diaminohydroxyphosphoribosylaminopyrimidine deaminase/5-amino-6-(5-phosphoribosylamino)uracil reductase RibD n=1 Tax=Pseudogemmobacter faecipullorum TaxID=2755041 RepID=A0ABS8CSN9_9RHOB|nr:bifunctional diaminohydroxyphosphoribosylaminopyrimidine deaminase/5-amino-6-(5-phosphoribosylamino)uracil reductase RibD [Pseudogemmobacter faecipullorum]
MGRALALARQMRGHVWPNPPVGCVIVKDGVVIAEGDTQPGGRPHTERVALDRAGASAAGSTLYVTLEPCCHWGKTPPCADAIIAAGVARVVAAMQDPDPRVNGGGFQRLREAGIEVSVGEGETDARAIMSGFLHRTRTGEPELILSECTLTEVPEGVDGLLETRDGVCSLRLRNSQQLPIEAADFGREGLLHHLGALGLTSVALWRDDPLRTALCSTPA